MSMYVKVKLQDKLHSVVRPFCHLPHPSTCMNSYYIAYYCEELDYFPPLLNGVNVVGCGSASLPTWITHSLGEGIRYDFIDNVLCRFSASPASQVNGRC